MNSENKLIIIPFSNEDRYYIQYKVKGSENPIAIPLRFGNDYTIYSFY